MTIRTKTIVKVFLYVLLAFSTMILLTLICAGPGYLLSTNVGSLYHTAPDNRKTFDLGRITLAFIVIDKNNNPSISDGIVISVGQVSELHDSRYWKPGEFRFLVSRDTPLYIATIERGRQESSSACLSGPFSAHATTPVSPSYVSGGINISAPGFRDERIYFKVNVSENTDDTIFIGTVIMKMSDSGGYYPDSVVQGDSRLISTARKIIRTRIPMDKPLSQSEINTVSTIASKSMSTHNTRNGIFDMLTEHPGFNTSAPFSTPSPLKSRGLGGQNPKSL